MLARNEREDDALAWKMENAEAELRYLEVDGRQKLQQRWRIEARIGERLATTFEWRDVPVVKG